MASERDDAKSGIIDKDKDDPELQKVLTDGHQFQLAQTQEKNRHAVAMRETEMGLLGRWLGSGQSAAYSIAAITLVTCLLAGTLVWAWAGIADAGKALYGIATTALGFMFGRGSKKD